MDDDRSPFRVVADDLAARLPRFGARAALGAAAFSLVLGLTLIRTGTEGGSGPPQPEPAARQAGARPPGPSATAPQDGGRGEPKPLPPAHAPLAASPPTRIAIPSIGVDAPLTEVGLGADGLLEVPPPQEDNLAGWYAEAATPGERGTALVVGHVDNASGPAVFFRLGALRTGAEVTVARKDGRTAVFTVYAVELHRKEAFPGDRVYRDTGRAELRVITCGGGYAEETGYQGNVVAFARLTGVR